MPEEKKMNKAKYGELVEAPMNNRELIMILESTNKPTFEHSKMKHKAG